MGDSHEKVQEKRVMTDSSTRLEMILESMIWVRLFKKKTKGNGYLLFCKPAPLKDEDGGSEESEWEGRINMIKKYIRQSESKFETESQRIREDINKIATLLDQRMSKIEGMLLDQSKKSSES